jgi:hypothetical protein
MDFAETQRACVMRAHLHWLLMNANERGAGCGSPARRVPLRRLGSGRRLFALLFLLCLTASGLAAGERDGRWAILVSGVSGDPELQKSYLEVIRDLHSVLVGSLGFPRDQVTVLFDDPSKDPDLIQYPSTRKDFQDVCLKLAKQVQKEDLVFVFIEGHGDYDGTIYKLNLKGPDPTAEDLAAVLYAIPAKYFIVVDATNCSGGSIPALSRKDTILVSATKSGMEKNLTHFGRYFVDALKDNAADSDKNGRVSILEAFSYTRLKVEEYYAREGNLQTEHAVLEDNGDAQAQSNPAPENGEGLLARNTFLDTGIAANAQDNRTPEEQKLALEARELERQIETLKYAKSELPEAEYETKLEELLLRLARINAKLK